MAIASDGPVASVALFTTKPLDQVRTVAADTSSRTSAGLLRVLCFERFGIDPVFEPMAPDAATMLRRCDAALIIGDPALFLDHAAMGATKIDLGEEWTSMTGLPFVWAFWAGRPDALPPPAVTALAHARDAGVAASDAIAAAYCGAERALRGQAYLRENIRYSVGEREQAGVAKYYELAAKHGVVERTRALLYY
jgi:predicted solute-binding protein